MLDGVPNLKTNPGAVVNGSLGFLTDQEIRTQETVKDLQDWVQAGFDILDFPYPKGLSIDCNTAREILSRAGLLRTKQLDS